MTIYASYDPTALFAGDFPHMSRPVTIASGANAAGTFLPRGTVLGITTSSLTAIVAVATATDGSAKPTCILAADVDASTGPVVAPAYFTGEFADCVMTFGAGHTAATVDAAFASTGQPIFIRTVGSVA